MGATGIELVARLLQVPANNTPAQFGPAFNDNDRRVRSL